MSRLTTIKIVYRTPNFSNKNASKVFAVLGNQYDEDGNHIWPEEFDIDEAIVYYREQLKELPFDYFEMDVWDNNRSYPARCIAELYSSKQYGDIEFTITVSCMIRSAYYDGANLDWEVEYGENYDDLEYAIEAELSFSESMNKGMQELQKDNIRTWAENKTSEMIEAIEKIYEQASTPLRCVGVFSNGEAIYERADTLRAVVNE